MVLFGFMFIVYVHDRYQNLSLFLSARPQMNETLGLTNTLLLLASSWFVASGVAAARMGRLRIARGALLGGICCALGFCTVKFFEYREKLEAGITPATNLFFTYYFGLTGIHLVHVIVAIGVMSFAVARCGRASLTQKDFVFIESAASFWHLVDILWIMLFALLYLMR
jgi:nitric oxide reductase NorE protein